MSQSRVTAGRRAGNGAAGALGLALLGLVAVCGANPWFVDDLRWLLLGLGVVGLGGAGIGWRMGPSGPWGLRLLPVLLMLSLGTRFWPKPGPQEDVALLIFGMDGATFDRIDAMGPQLPTLQGLQARGSRATLWSMEPMFSPLLWTTMASGLPPADHGVRGFRVQATDCEAARFWDIARAAGMTAGTYKWLVSYPPDAALTFQVPAWLAPAPETWPPGYRFVKELELGHRQHRKKVDGGRSLPVVVADGLRRGLRLSTLVRAAGLLLQGAFDPDPVAAYVDGQLLRVAIDRDVFVHLLHARPAQVVSFTDYATDAIPHRVWRYDEPDRFPGTDPALVARHGEDIEAAYRQADAVLAELIAAVGPQARVVVLSDHGSRATTATSAGRFFSPRTERLRDRITAAVGPVDVSRLGHKLVVSVGEGTDRAAVKAALLDLRLDRTGAPFYRADDLPDDPRAIGLTLVDEDLPATQIAADTLSGEPLRLYVAAEEDESGEHDARGVFLAAGPGLAAGRLADLQLLDVAPTLLALLGLPGAADMPGRAPDALWTEPPTLPPGPPTYRPLVAERALVGGEAGVDEALLRALGYIE